MPTFGEAANHLATSDLYLYTDPEVLDFTDPAKQAGLTVASSKLSVTFDFPTGWRSIRETFGSLAVVLGEASADNRIILTWKMKNFFSYWIGRCGGNPQVEGQIYDLNLLEGYLGIWEDRPASFADAMARLKRLSQHPGWGKAKEIYRTVYIPLLHSVIPSIETTGVTDRESKRRIFPHYEIAGQINGRMKCINVYSRCFNPHSILPDKRPHLVPHSPYHKFLCFDYKHMEVSFLQWLSGDEVLKGFLDSGDDLYKRIWTLLTTLECSEDDRKRCKGFFLPVVFGQGPKGLADKSGVSESTAVKLIDRIHLKLPTAMYWIQKQQERANKLAMDYLGRCREIVEGESYKVRNFVIQSPASMFCLEKLVALHRVLEETEARIAMHIHDGFVVASPSVDREMAGTIQQCLESPSELFPGLSLKVACSEGESLGELDLK